MDLTIIAYVMMLTYFQQYYPIFILNHILIGAVELIHNLHIFSVKIAKNILWII